MATMPGKTDRYFPNTGWQPASYIGGMMPGIVPDQSVAQSPSYTNTPAYNPADYAGLYPASQQPYQSGMLGRGSYPMSGTASPIDLAAINAQGMPGGSQMGYAGAPSAIPTAGSPTTTATAAMKPQGWQGLLSTLFGPSKNGLTGVPGLLGGYNSGGPLGHLFGGQNAGGLLAQLFGQHKTGGLMSAIPSSTPSQAYASTNAPRPNASTSTGIGTNGYTYSNGVVTGVAPQYANMTPSQMYDAINAKAGNPTNTSGRGSLVSNTGSLI